MLHLQFTAATSQQIILDTEIIFSHWEECKSFLLGGPRFISFSYIHYNSWLVAFFK